MRLVLHRIEWTTITVAGREIAADYVWVVPFHQRLPLPVFHMKERWVMNDICRNADDVTWREKIENR